MSGRFIAELTLTILLCLSGWSCTEDETGGPPPDEEDFDSSESVADEPNPALLIPSLAHEQAPASYKARFETTKGSFVVKVEREWAPNGADRFFNLTKIGYFEDIAFFRAIEGFVVQFGISGNAEINQQWANARIKDDPVKYSNKRSYVTFAMAGPNSRTTQLFINLRDNSELDSQGFAPIGRVIEGMSVIDSLYTGYGEMAPKGKGPRSRVLNARGNDYLRMQFPDLDYINNVVVLE